MHIRTRRAQMTIQQQMPTFKVNWEQIRSESGLTPMIRQSVEAGYYGHSLGQQGIANMAENGNIMSQIGKGSGDGVGNVARNSVMRNLQKEFNLSSMPKNLPKIEWDPGYTDISWAPHELIVEWDMDPKPQISFNPHSVDIRIKQHAEVKITYDPEYFEMQGRKQKIDRKI